MSKSVALYFRNYLPVSQTFVYRQLTSDDEFERHVLTEKVENRRLFPFPRIHRKRGRLSWLWSVVHRRVLRSATSRWFLALPSQSRVWRAHWKRHRYALVHCHFGTTATWLLPSIRAGQVPLVVTYHGIDASKYLRDPAYQKTLSEVFEYGRLHLCVCEAFRIKLEALGCPPERLRTLYLGVPVDQLTPVDGNLLDRPRRLIQVGRMVEKKGQVYLVRSFARVVKRFPDATLTLVGDGPERAAVKREVSRLNLDASVKLTGALPNARAMELLSEHAIFVHHAVTAADGDQEGLPIGILEAMARGMPVVSTVHSGIPEAIEHGSNGLLAAERDVDTFARHIETLMDNSELARSLGTKAAQTIRARFDLKQQNEELTALYRKVAAW